jgi:hypothetical protein
MDQLKESFANRYIWRSIQLSASFYGCEVVGEWLRRAV